MTEAELGGNSFARPRSPLALKRVGIRRSVCSAICRFFSLPPCRTDGFCSGCLDHLATFIGGNIAAHGRAYDEGFPPA